MQPNVEGIFFDEAGEVYHADAVYEVPSLSGSLAKILIDKTPRHCWWAASRLNPKFVPEHKGIWDRGNAVHALMLNSGAEVEVVDLPDWRSKGAKVAKEAVRAAGKVPVLRDDYAEIIAALDLVTPQLDRLEGGDPFADGKPEVVLRWLDQFIAPDGRALSVWCRARLDWFNPLSDNATDLKSMAGSADPASWCRWTMWSIGAPYQAAFYRRGLRRLAQLGVTGAYDPDFLFLLVESKPPYGLSMVNVPGTIRQRRGDKTADEKIIDAMTLWHDCLQANDWPGYAPEVFIAEGAGELPNPQWSQQQAGPLPTGGHVESNEMPDSAFTPIEFKRRGK